MDDEQKAAELAAEQAATQAPKEDELRAKIVEEFGFDETDDLERIDKLVKKEMDSHKKLSTAISQKIKYRTEAEGLKKVTPPPQDNKTVDPVDVEKTTLKILEKRDLEAIDTSDEIKKEIQRVADIQGVSIKQAARDPYIVSQMTTYEKEQKTEAASISRKNNSSGSKKYTFDNPPEVDLSTKEGREEWDSYKKDMIKQGY